MIIARIFCILLAGVFFQNQAMANGMALKSEANQLVSTMDFVEKAERQNLKADILNKINQKDVSEKLISMGYSVDDINSRINNLTPTELAELDQSMRNTQAGGILVTVLVVILIIYFAQRI